MGMFSGLLCRLLLLIVTRRVYASVPAPAKFSRVVFRRELMAMAWRRACVNRYRRDILYQMLIWFTLVVRRITRTPAYSRTDDKA